MHYAWVIVGLVFVSQFAANTVGFYAFGVLLEPLERDLGATRAHIASIPLVLSLAGAVIGPLMGRAVLRYPIHRIMAAGALAMAAAFFAMARAHSVAELQLGYALGVAVGLGTLSGVPAHALIVNWFEERRAFALGVAGVGISLAGALMTPITAMWVASLGWRSTFGIFGALVLAMVPLVWCLAVSHPRERGERAYGAPPGPAEPDGPDAAGDPARISTSALLRDPNLHWIGIAAGVGFMAATGVIAHLVALGTGAGFEPVDAAFLLSTLAAAAALAKVLFGWAAGRFGERAAFTCAIGCELVGLVGLAESGGRYAALLAASAALGLGMGGIVPLMGALVARVFGPLRFGPAMGLAAPVLTLSQSIGAPVLGYAYDASGSYGPGLWAMAAAMSVPVLALRWIRLPDEIPLGASDLA